MGNMKGALEDLDKAAKLMEAADKEGFGRFMGAQGDDPRNTAADCYSGAPVSLCVLLCVGERGKVAADGLVRVPCVGVCTQLCTLDLCPLSVVSCQIMISASYPFACFNSPPTLAVFCLHGMTSHSRSMACVSMETKRTRWC